MLKSIIQPSSELLNFLGNLSLNISKPPQKHLWRIVEALIASEERKTLAGLYRQWVEAPDVSAGADFFRQSPWSEQQVRQALSKWVIADLIQRTLTQKIKPIIYVSIDDSLTSKDKDTSALEGVDWYHDHHASTKKKSIDQNGAVHLSCRVQFGEYSYTFAWRMYLRAKTVRRLNQKRPKNRRLKFKSKYRLAREMLVELKPLIPQDCLVYVLFDSWYASAKLIKFIRRQGKSWHVLCALKSNRTLDGIQVAQLNQQLKHKRYTTVKVQAADGTQTYYVRKVQGYLSNVSFPVCVIISQRHPLDKRPKYYLCTDLNLSVHKILSWYLKRWSIEVDYWYLKQKFGLGDWRVHSWEAIQKWYTVVYLTFIFLQWRLYQVRQREPSAKSVADMIRLHRGQQARELLLAACTEAISEGNVDKVMERFLYPTREVYSRDSLRVGSAD